MLNRRDFCKLAAVAVAGCATLDQNVLARQYETDVYQPFLFLVPRSEPRTKEASYRSMFATLCMWDGQAVAVDNETFQPCTNVVSVPWSNKELGELSTSALKDRKYFMHKDYAPRVVTVVGSTLSIRTFAATEGLVNAWYRDENGDIQRVGE